MTHGPNPLEGWNEEKQSAWLYRIVSEAERDSGRAALFQELGKAAEQQAGIWADLARERGTFAARGVSARLACPPGRPVDPSVQTPPSEGVLAAMKVRGMSIYASGHYPTPDAA